MFEGEKRCGQYVVVLITIQLTYSSILLYIASGRSLAATPVELSNYIPFHSSLPFEHLGVNQVCVKIR